MDGLIKIKSDGLVRKNFYVLNRRKASYLDILKNIMVGTNHINSNLHLKISGIHMADIGDSEHGLEWICLGFFNIKECNARSIKCELEYKTNNCDDDW